MTVPRRGLTPAGSHAIAPGAAPRAPQQPGPWDSTVPALGQPHPPSASNPRCPRGPSQGPRRGHCREPSTPHRSGEGLSSLLTFSCQEACGCLNTREALVVPASRHRRVRGVAGRGGWNRLGSGNMSHVLPDADTMPAARAANAWHQPGRIQRPECR